MKTHPISRTALGTVLGVAMLTAPVAATAAEGDIVLVKGISYDTEMSNFRGFGQSFGPEQAAQLRARACSGDAKLAVATSLPMLEDAWNQAFGWGVAPFMGPAPTDKIVDTYLDFCEEPTFPAEGFVVMYSECAMYMWQDQQEMLIVLPPSSRGAHMTLRAPGEEPIVADLQGASAVMDAMVPIGARIYTTDVSRTGGQEPGDWLGLPTYPYEFSYDGSAGAPLFAGMPPIGVPSRGTASIAPDAPGLDIIRAFYSNFAEQVRTPDVVNGFLSGLVDQMGAIIEEGMPVYIEQTVSSTTTFPAVVGRSGTSYQSISGVSVIRAADAPQELSRFCDSSIVAPGERVQDLNQLAATGGAGATSEEQAEMARAMEEARKAMEALDPETRRMMEQMGIPIPGM